MRAFGLTLALPVMVGCGNISNAVFTEDADFAAALPAETRTTLSAPPGADTSTPPALLATTLDVGTALDDWLLTVTAVADTIRSAAPASRTEDGRTWGAYDWSGSDLTASMDRTGGTRYDWAVESNGAGFAAGTHYAGLTVAAGDGTFAWDQTSLSEQTGETSAGRVDVAYENRDGVDLVVVVDDWTPDSDATDPTDAAFAYTLVTGSGDFQFSTTLDLGDEVGAPAVVRARWVENVGGRADALVSLGTGLEDTWTECWDNDGALIYETDSLEKVEPVGLDAACAVHGVELPDRI